ncbi:MAG: STAS domain-containing protein [bacterium]|nr:STAS domain-containing protein [bacterium]
MAKETLNYSVRDYEGIKVLDVTGNLTINTIDTLIVVVEALVEKESLMINMENVHLVTSAGLNCLIELSFFAKEKENRVVVLWPSEDFVRMTEIMDVFSYLTFAESREEGKAKIDYYT